MGSDGDQSTPSSPGTPVPPTPAVPVPRPVHGLVNGKAGVANGPPRTAFDWYELKLAAAGATAGAAATNPERIFFSPTLDATTPIKEGRPPLDWSGYHTGKHGVWERWINLKGEEVSMGDAFFGEKFRWVQSQYLKSPNELLTLTDAEFMAKLKRVYKKGKVDDLSVIFDSDKFTQDAKTLFDQNKLKPSSTVWQGRYLTKDPQTGALVADVLQTNVDFQFNGSKFRIAVDAKTGRALNFFRILEGKANPMKFTEVVLKWKGSATDVTPHTLPGSTITVGISATWTRLFLQGVKAGSITGAVVTGFFGAIDGFKKEGMVGALKGLAIGGGVGAVVGAATGGFFALIARVAPVVGKVLGVLGFVTTVLSILLDATETGLDPQEFGNGVKDGDGNLWAYRHIVKTGSAFSPERVPHGARIICTDGTILEFGDDEFGAESNYGATPITTYAFKTRVRWHMARTPEGSTMWWWQDLATLDEFSIAYDSDETMRAALALHQDESSFRFIPTQN
jgi:hypothetical protein